MKKILVLILSIAVMFSFASCDFFGTKRNPNSTSEKVKFSTVDRYGVKYTEDICKDYDLTIINLWEPWCKPCVSELPALNNLYRNYKDKGVLILGVYSETDMEREVYDLMSYYNISYPLLHSSSDFKKYSTGHIPTTIFVDKDGYIINVDKSQGKDGTRLIGARSYADWEKLVKDNLISD